MKKTILITGSSKGIGSYTAITLARKGHNVIITYNKSKKEGKKILNECKKYSDPLLLKLDLTKESSILNVKKKIFKKYGKLDILINNAGVRYNGKIENQTFKQIQEQIDINLTGPIKLTSILTGKVDMIINICSVAGKFGLASVSPYCASKFGLRGFTMAIGKELPKIYSINPNRIATSRNNYQGISPKKVAEVISSLIEGKITKTGGIEIECMKM